jgi:hypothetical protein
MAVNRYIIKIMRYDTTANVTKYRGLEEKNLNRQKSKIIYSRPVMKP